MTNIFVFVKELLEESNQMIEETHEEEQPHADVDEKINIASGEDCYV